MTCNGCLERIASAGIVRELEKVNIDRSLMLLKQRLNAHFNNRDGASNGSGIKAHFVFGSYTRGTMLTRKMDPHSDVDYMVIFADANLKPQSCLDRLKRFVGKNYPASEIFQSHPTIILSLNHIQFELVPAIETSFSGVQIPIKNSFFSHWTGTSPNEFNKALIEKNGKNNLIIKPLVRLLKYWNACNRYPFDSFDLENRIVDHWTLRTMFGEPNLWKRFRDFLRTIETNAQRQELAVSRAKKIIAEVSELEAQKKPDLSVEKLRRLLPEVV